MWSTHLSFEREKERLHFGVFSMLMHTDLLQCSTAVLSCKMHKCWQVRQKTQPPVCVFILFTCLHVFYDWKKSSLFHIKLGDEALFWIVVAGLMELGTRRELHGEDPDLRPSFSRESWKEGVIFNPSHSLNPNTTPPCLAQAHPWLLLWPQNDWQIEAKLAGGMLSHQLCNGLLPGTACNGVPPAGGAKPATAG